MSPPSLDLDEVAKWIAGRRWFGSKSRRLLELRLLDLVVLDPAAPRLCLGLAALRFEAGPEETYGLPLVLAAPGERPAEARIAGSGGGEAAYDALADRRDPPRLLERMVAGEQVSPDGEDGGGEVAFHWVEGAPPPPPGAEARPLSAEQSNSSVVYGENAILKLYRRLEDGVNPELELLRRLGEEGFREIPTLLGWFEYRGPALEATLGVAQELIADGRDGWELALDVLAGDPAGLLEPLGELGATIGAMHTALAADSSDPDFAPERRGEEWLAAAAAELDREVERVLGELPADERLAPIASRGTELRERVRALAGAGDAGMAIRVHGDLHLGQTLRSDRGWTVLDFEGEPARTLAERRAKSSPLRDVAGVLRSLAYAPLAARLQRGAEPPAGWEAEARERFLAGYLEAVRADLLPPSRRGIDLLLSLYELEKAIYELRYELNHRPDWVEIPVAGIARLLDTPDR